MDPKGRFCWFRIERDAQPGKNIWLDKLWRFLKNVLRKQPFGRQCNALLRKNSPVVHAPLCTGKRFLARKMTPSFFSFFSSCSVNSHEGQIERRRNDRVCAWPFRHGNRSKSPISLLEGGSRQKVQPVASKSNSLISSGSREGRGDILYPYGRIVRRLIGKPSMDSGGEPGSRGAFLIRITCARTASLFGNSRWIILTRFQLNHAARLINEEPYLGWTIADNKLTQLSSATRKRAWNGKHTLHNIGNGSARLETTASRSNLFKWHYRRSQVVGEKSRTF